VVHLIAVVNRAAVVDRIAVVSRVDWIRLTARALDMRRNIGQMGRLGR
jgi:hypothetical protein